MPAEGDNIYQRELFSVCEKLVGCYLKAGWLRVASSYAKQDAEGSAWIDYFGDSVQEMLREIIKEVRKNDPVQGV